MIDKDTQPDTQFAQDLFENIQREFKEALQRKIEESRNIDKERK
jgi:hypothetical protein